ncbi:MAG: AI-2E family transporter [Oscillospiraceae bacterium]
MIYNFIISLIFISLFYIFFKYIFFSFLPFLIGFFISSFLRPIILIVHKTLKLSYKVSSFIILILFHLVIIILIAIIINIFIHEFNIISQNIHTYKNLDFSDIFQNKLNEFISTLEKNFNINILFKNTDIQLFFANLAKKIISYIILFTSKLPNLFFSIMLSMMSSIFFTIDYEKFKKFIENILNTKSFNFVYNFKKITYKNIKKLLKAQLILMFFTFCFLTVSFILIKLDFWLTASTLIALFDFLPLIGTGMFFIPWIIFALIINNNSLALQLLLIYFSLNFIKNILEPHIIGSQINVHPLVTLTSIYFGTKIFGIIGMISAPLITIIVIDIFKNNKQIN